MTTRISRALVAWVAAFGLSGAAACSSSDDPAAAGSPTPAPSAAASGVTAPVYPGTDDGARALMKRLGSVGDRTLLQALQPGAADYEALFEPSFAARAEKRYAEMWTQLPSSDRPFAKPEQTELHLYKAATEQVRSWTPQVKADFPGGYEHVKDQFRPGFTIYVWRYVVPGEQLGIFCNGLVFINGHWAYFPKPWEVSS
jgi:hypothetical protein